MTREEIQYALSKKIPSMETGFNINTNYGEIFIDIDEAKDVAEFIKKF